MGDANTAGTIYKDVVDNARSRRVFRETVEIVKNNPDLQVHSEFYSIFIKGYVNDVLLYIRRQTDRTKGVDGLKKLLENMKRNHQQITRSFLVGIYKECYPDPPMSDEAGQMGHAHFERFAGATVDFADPALIQADIDRLEAIHSACSEFVNNRIAHLNTKVPSTIPTFAEIEGWLDEIREMFVKYYGLIHGSHVNVEPVLTHDWKAIFRIPWIPSS